MIIKATCIHCNNKDPAQFKQYDGALGYEAIVCRKCGTYVDVNGSHFPDTWSRELVGLPEPKE
jgi:hypothetical protein